MSTFFRRISLWQRRIQSQPQQRKWLQHRLAISTVEVKAAETKTVKAEAKAEAPKAEAKKAEEPKKETAKKAPAKRTTAKDIKTSVVVQFAGKEVTEKDLIAAVKKAYTKKGNKVGDIKTIEIYVKPEESAAYYVVNGIGADDYKIEL